MTLQLRPRELLKYPTDLLFSPEMINSRFDVAFDDGVTLNISQKQLTLNRYFWELFTNYPTTPIPSQVCISVMHKKGTILNADTHKTALEKIFKYICDSCGLHSNDQMLPLLKHVQVVHNWFYNDLILGKLSSHMSTISARDLIQVATHPKIEEIHREMTEMPDSMDAAYKTISKFLNDPTNGMANNNFVHAIRSGAVNSNQANQCIGPRGVIASIDRKAYRHPVMTGFITGLRRLYDVLIESQTAAKALLATDSSIRDSEYLSRQLQLLAMVIERVVYGDCGSTSYVDMLVTQPVLNNLKGCYYLCEIDNVLKMVTGDETHLLNKVIKLRNVLGCKLSNKHHVCSTCCGEISNNLKSNTNIGYAYIAYLMEKITQMILSTKHLTHSVKNSGIILTGLAANYFAAAETGHLLLKPNLNKSKLKVTLFSNQLVRLVDVFSLPHNKVSLSRIGEITSVVITDSSGKIVQEHDLDMTYMDRSCILTKEFLIYIKSSALETDSRGNFIVPLDGWDATSPMFFSPLKEKNITSFINTLASIIQTQYEKSECPYEKLDRAFSHVLEQFNCNFTIIQTLILATTIASAERKDFSIARGVIDPVSRSETVLMANRSLGQVLPYEVQTRVLYSDFTKYRKTGRPRHPMDVFFTPNAVVKAELRERQN